MKKLISTLLLLTLLLCCFTGCGDEDNSSQNNSYYSSPTNVSYSETSTATSGTNPVSSNDILVEENKDNGEYVYDVYGNHIEIKQYLGKSSKVSVPEEIDGKKVTTISHYTKSNRYSIDKISPFSKVVSVELPDTVTEIGDYAFYQSDIASIRFSDNVTKIGNYAFSECSNLKGMTLPSALTEMGVQAFSNTSMFMEKLVIPAGVKEIPEKAFCECKSIKEVVFSNGVEEIGNRAFQYCSSLEKVSFPDSLIKIYLQAFNECNISGDVTIPKNVKIIGTRAFFHNYNISSLSIPENVEIHPYAFFGISPKEIIIPKGVTFPSTQDGLITEYGYVFDSGPNDNLQLEKVTVNSEKVVESMFSGQRKLKEIFLSDDVLTIEESAFSGINKQCKIHIPASVINIDQRAFFWYDDYYKDDDYNQLTIYGKKNSTAETFAKEHNIKFIEE